MDLKALLDEALQEANNDLKEQKIKAFKQTVRDKVAAISRNNEIIAAKTAENAEIRKQMAALDLPEVQEVSL